MAEVRIYVNKGCPHCEAVKKFFEDQKIPVELIEVGFDPLIQAGLRTLAGGQNLGLPITISFVTQETIVGNELTHLQRVADAVISNWPVPSDHLVVTG